MNSTSGSSVQSSGSSASVASLPLADAIALLRCPATGQRLLLREVDGQRCVSSEDGSVRFEIQDGLVLFVTGRREGGEKAESKE